MRKNLTHIIFSLWLITLLVACNQENNSKFANQVSNVPKDNSQQKYHGTTIKAIFSRGSNKVSGNFNQVHYNVETNSNRIILKDKLDCYDKGSQIECSATTDLSKLNPGIYRLMVKHQNGLLGCDLFEISPGIIPVLITIDNESTGLYLSSVIMQKTQLSQKEIYTRVAFILGGRPDQDYDLEPTLYDLFMYYHGDKNSNRALNELVNAIAEQQPLHIKRDSGISNTMKPLL